MRMIDALTISGLTKTYKDFELPQIVRTAQKRPLVGKY